jgi:hypothetical protein
LLGENDQFLHRQPLQFGDVNIRIASLDLFVTLIGDKVGVFIFVVIRWRNSRGCFASECQRLLRGILGRGFIAGDSESGTRQSAEKRDSTRGELPKVERPE